MGLCWSLERDVMSDNISYFMYGDFYDLRDREHLQTHSTDQTVYTLLLHVLLEPFKVTSKLKEEK